jgi:hypothetical protein
MRPGSRSRSRHAPAAAGIALALAAGALGGAGCGQTFEPFNRLTSLRVLALKSEPVAPETGVETTLSAKVYPDDPADPTPISYAWSWCPLAGSSSDGYPCLVTEDQVSQWAGAPISFDLGAQPTATLKNAFDPSVLQAICAGTLGLPVTVRCTNGLPVNVKLTVSRDGDSVTAVRTLRLLYAAEPAGEKNENPIVSGLFAVIGGVNQPLDAAGTPLLPRRQKTKVGVDPDVIQSEVQIYTGTDDNGQPATLSERLILTWFVETGDTKSQRTELIVGSTTLENATQNQWTPALHRDYPQDTARMIVIVRDDRDGVGWSDGITAVSLEKTP